MKKLLEYLQKGFAWIGKAIDWFGKNMGRIKTGAVAVMTILLIVSFVRGGCSRQDAANLLHQVTGLDIQINNLQSENKILVDSLVSEVQKRMMLQREKDSLLNIKLGLDKDNEVMRKRIASIPQWILNIPADSSYKYLQEKAYPYAGEKRFPFNEPQVKNIHADYLENQELNSLVFVMQAQLVNCEKIGELADSVSLSFQKSYSMVMSQNSNLQQQFNTSQQKAGILEKGLTKANRGKTFWRITTAIASVVAIVALL